jgi:acetoin utilization protein AcuB
MTVAEIMTPNVVTVSMDDTLRQIRQIFERHRFHHVVVVERGKAVGVISDRDVLKHLSPFVGKLSERTQDLESLQRRAHQIMSRQLISAPPTTTIGEAITLMIQRDISCLVVTDPDGKCVGIVTSRDMLRWCTRCALPESQAAPAAGPLAA